jgi:hypothetical protein
VSRVIQFNGSLLRHVHTPIVAIAAVQHVRRMCGGTQSHLMRASDNNLYVVKFQNNPQGVRVLANELIATHLALAVGLPVPAAAVIEVPQSLLEGTPELHIQLAGCSVPCQPGVQYGSRYAIQPYAGQVFDAASVSMLASVRNLHEFAGMLVFDKWVCNTDFRQAIFWRRSRERRYAASFIDHGYCFGGTEWTFPDGPLHGAYRETEVYKNVTGWESFEPWLSRIERLDDSIVWRCRAIVPQDWYLRDSDSLNRLLERLLKRREWIRGLIEAFRESSRQPFPNWRV